MEILAIFNCISSVVIFMFSVWFVFGSDWKNTIFLKKGFIALAFGSYANIVHPSENSKTLIIMALAFICLLRTWEHRKSIFDSIHRQLVKWHYAA